MLEAYGNKIVCMRIGDETKTSKGVVRPSSKKEKPLEVEVVDSAVDGISIGDKLCIARYSGTEVFFDDKELVVVTPEDILFKIKEK